MRWRFLILLATAAVMATTLVGCATARPPILTAADRPQNVSTWYGAWGASMTAGGPSFHNETIREVIRTTVSGDAVRLHLTNWLGSAPVTFGEIDLAVCADGGRAVRGSNHEVTFAGTRMALLLPGADRVSDPVDIAVKAGELLLVSLYIPGTTGSSNVHGDAFTTTYISQPGDHARAALTSSYRTKIGSSYYVDGLDVASRTARATVVAFGDSITDGTGSTFGANRRWPDDLARRLGGGFAVVDAGIAGNRVLTDSAGPAQGIAGEVRFTHDALDVTGVKVVILLEGINDIGTEADPYAAPLSAQDLIGGYENLIAQAHAAHVRILGATILPYRGALYDTAAGEAIRQTVNTWIRTSGAFDGVIDFAAATSSRSKPLALNPAYDCGDHLHPNDSGAQAMADAANPALLNGSPPAA